MELEDQRSTWRHFLMACARVRALEDRLRRREAFWKKQISEPVTVLFPDEMHDLLDPEIVWLLINGDSIMQCRKYYCVSWYEQLWQC